MSKRLPSLPSLPKMKTYSRCACGCTGLTGNRFVPGHDAKLASWVKRVNAGVFDPSDPLNVTAQLDAALDYLTVNEVEHLAAEIDNDWNEDSYLERTATIEPADGTTGE